jgi:HTH-type transcriptional regulator, sugar sensing transcriptional regulator
MFLEKSLIKLGLSEKQAKVYLALLELDSAKISDIAAKANIKRSTTYLIIDELLQKGLVSEYPSYKGNKYTIENPEKLKNILNEQKKELDYAFPFIHKMYNKEKERPQVKVYEGLEAIRQVYLDYVFKSETEVLFFSSLSKVLDMVPDLNEMWRKEIIKQQNFKGKEILNPSKKDIEYGLKAIKNSKNLEIKVLPKDSKYQFKDSECAIFDDQVMFVAYGSKIFTTLIKSQLLTESLKALFFQTWEHSTPVTKFIKK